MTLENILDDFVRGKLTETNDWYSWRSINPKHLPKGITLQKGNQFSQNVELKLRLHELWTNTTDENIRYELAQYYVAVWGGVRGNSQKTLESYVREKPVDTIKRGHKGVASWSKLLCVRNPEDYAIFDARVSVALNSLQVSGNVSNPFLFPLLSSRNRVIKDGNRQIRDFAERSKWNMENADFYCEYIKLLKAVAKKQNPTVPIYTVEMLLFSQAEILLSTAFQKHREIKHGC